jgi:cell division GTPase FtsZ
LAEGFWDLGYRAVCAVNTSDEDLDGLSLPKDNQLDLGGGGAGKDPEIARGAADGRDEDIYDLYKRTLGTEIDYALVCIGAGGGTGAGGYKKCLEVLRRYLDENNRPIRVGIVVALPRDSEGQKPARNALRVLQDLLKEELAPFIIVDNERLNTLFSKVPASKFWSTCNNHVCRTFHLFNRISAQTSAHTSFDRQDLSKVLDSGIVTFGASKVKEVSEVGVSKVIRAQLDKTTLAELDLRTGSCAGCIFICGPEVYETVTTDVLEHGFAMFNRILREGSTVFRGVYAGAAEGMMCVSIVGDLTAPRARMETLAKIAGIPLDG